MRLTATDKAIGELNMRKADIERAAHIVASGTDCIAAAADIDRCIELLKSVAPAPKPEKVAKERKPRKSKKEVAE